ncbi:DUF427 domain-containing protein [Streptomyces tanashiensis]|uniref:DUF427 domain-containing protein n=1 Tax=Streptomyces tanashiensis TaxID=67367 RepID=UPI0033FA2B27
MSKASGEGHRSPKESVWHYPRPPRIEADTRHVVVRYRDVTLADSHRCLRVLETSHPPTFYVPRSGFIEQ